MVKTLVSETTRDPEFARFRFLTGCQASNGHTIICGEVNAKNAYGGYAGYTPLWVRIDGKELIAARFAADIADTVRTRCNEVKSGITTIAPNAKMKCFGVLARYKVLTEENTWREHPVYLEEQGDAERQDEHCAHDQPSFGLKRQHGVTVAHSCTFENDRDTTEAQNIENARKNQRIIPII